MAKHKYKFNPATLKYVKVKRTPKENILRGLGVFFASFILATGYYVIFSTFFDLPKEKGLRRQLSDYSTNFQLVQEQLTFIDSVLKDLQERDDNIYRTIFGAEPIHSSIREAGSGGSYNYDKLHGMENAEIIHETADQLEKIFKKSYIQSKSYDQIIDLAKNKEQMLASVPAIMPIANKDLKRTASGWGYRIHPIYKIRKFHYGMDFTAPKGTEIYATGDGVIEVLNRSKRGYGNKIILNHGYGYKTLYGHMSAFNVKSGQKVKRGDVIGFVGNTGTSTADHLHYEVHLNNKKVNPVNYYFNDLTSDEYDRMVELSTKSGKTFD